MDVKDGVIWAYGLGDDHVMAFTDFGVETLVSLTKAPLREPPRSETQPRPLRPTPDAYAGICVTP